MTVIERNEAEVMAQIKDAGSDPPAFYAEVLEVLRGRREQVESLRQQLEGAVEERDAALKLLALYREHCPPGIRAMVNREAMRTPPAGGQ